MRQNISACLKLSRPQLAIVNCYNKLLVTIHHYSAIDLQGWLKTTFDVKMAGLCGYFQGSLRKSQANIERPTRAQNDKMKHFFLFYM